MGLPSGGDAIHRTPSRPVLLERKARRRGLRGRRGVGSHRVCRPEDGLLEGSEQRGTCCVIRFEGVLLCDAPSENSRRA